MSKTRALTAALGAVLFLSFAAPPAKAQISSGLSVAVLGLENSGGNPRQDYLASLAEGILRYDLSVLAEIPLVERRNLDRVFAEQEISLGWGTDPGQAIRVGSLLGATHLILGEYTVAAGELDLIVHLVDTTTGSAVTYRDRGASEHAVHRIAEKIAARLLDRRGIVFADAANDRSILSLRDETPGSIALYSPIRAAEIYLDGEFVGFTRGNELEPIVLESVRPGRHSIRVHLGGGDFGIVVLPQVEFKDWEAAVDVRPGGRHAIRDQTRHFNEILYRLEYLDSFEQKAERGSASRLSVSRSSTFTDRAGRTVALSLTVTPTETAESVSLALFIRAGEAEARGVIAFPAKEGSPASVRLVAGLAVLDAEISDNYGAWELDIRVRRTDIYQGLHREKR